MQVELNCLFKFHPFLVLFADRSDIRLTGFQSFFFLLLILNIILFYEFDKIGDLSSVIAASREVVQMAITEYK